MIIICDHLLGYFATGRPQIAINKASNTISARHAARRSRTRVVLSGSSGRADESNTSFRSGVLDQPLRCCHFIPATSRVLAAHSWMTPMETTSGIMTRRHPAKWSWGKYRFGADAMLSLAWFELVQDNVVRGDLLNSPLRFSRERQPAAGSKRISAGIAHNLRFPVRLCIYRHCVDQLAVLPGRILRRISNTD